MSSDNAIEDILSDMPDAHDKHVIRSVVVGVRCPLGYLTDHLNIDVMCSSGLDEDHVSNISFLPLAYAPQTLFRRTSLIFRLAQHTWDVAQVSKGA